MLTLVAAATAAIVVAIATSGPDKSGLDDPVDGRCETAVAALLAHDRSVGNPPANVNEQAAKVACTRVVQADGDECDTGDPELYEGLGLSDEDRPETVALTFRAVMHWRLGGFIPPPGAQTAVICPPG